MQPTLIAFTDDRYPTYLYLDLDTWTYILTGSIGIGGTWISCQKALNFMAREDVKTIHPDHIEAIMEDYLRYQEVYSAE